MNFETARHTLDRILGSATRRGIVAELMRSRNLGHALERMRAAFRSNQFHLGSTTVDLTELVRSYDSRTQADGFHVLQDWDGEAERLLPETIPIDVLTYFINRVDSRKPAEAGGIIAATLLDYYFLYLLILLAMRAWDEGDPDRNLDSVNELLHQLQGKGGSGHRFADNAPTLMLIGTSHFEADITAYDRLLERIRRTRRDHQLCMALVDAGILGCHLRYGFEAFYHRDRTKMRLDNVPDYPWLLFALKTLLEEYAGMVRNGESGVNRETVVESILNALSPDAELFNAPVPKALEACTELHAEISALLDAHRASLIEDLDRHRPTARSYSPVSFFFNFPHNLVKGVLVAAIEIGSPLSVGLNDLMRGAAHHLDSTNQVEAVALRLMGYARANPDTVKGRSVPAIIYDPAAGRRFAGRAITALKTPLAQPEA